jgi:hypothetical protein
VACIARPMAWHLAEWANCLMASSCSLILDSTVGELQENNFFYLRSSTICEQTLRFHLQIGSENQTSLVFEWSNHLNTQFKVWFSMFLVFWCPIHKAHLHFWRNFGEFSLVRYTQLCEVMSQF